MTVLVLALLFGFPILRRLRSGHRLTNALLTGNFDQSSVEQRFAAWFSERPARSEQRKTFVDLTLAMHCPSGIVADKLMASIMEVWGGKTTRFGDALAQQLDQLIFFDPPDTSEGMRKQQAALEQFNALKTRLRSLDSARSSQSDDPLEP